MWRCQQTEMDFSTQRTRTTLSKRTGPLRLLLVGKTGAGKSATGNMILGEKVFKTGAFGSSVTKEAKIGKSIVDDREIQVTDTLGLFDTTLTGGEVEFEVVRSLTCCHPGPHAVLFVIPVNRRFTDEEYYSYGRMKALFGENVSKFTIVVLTHSEIFETDEDATKEAFYQNAPPSLMTVLKECGSREIFVSNTADGQTKTQQRITLLQTIDSLGGIAYSESPYSKMTQQAVEEEIARRMLERSKIEVESNTYVKQVKEKKKVEKARAADEKARADLETEKAKAAQMQQEKAQLQHRADMEKLTMENQKALQAVQEASEKQIKTVTEHSEQMQELNRKIHEEEMERKRVEWELKHRAAESKVTRVTKYITGAVGAVTGFATALIAPVTAPLALAAAIASTGQVVEAIVEQKQSEETD